MNKKKYGKNRIFLSLILAVMVAACCFGCTSTTYDCRVWDDEIQEHVYLPDAERDTIIIGAKAFQVSYENSTEMIDGTMCHDYSVVLPDIDLPEDPLRQPEIILLDDGTLYSFSNIYPFEKIENVDSLTEEELRAAVEELLGDLIDSSIYNAFSVTDDLGYNLLWSVNRDVPCNIYLRIAINEEGYIEKFAKGEFCAEDFSEPFLKESERDSLIMQALKERYAQKGAVIEPDHFEIYSEMLTCDGANNAMHYWVIVYNKQGFSEMLQVVLTERHE